MRPLFTLVIALTSTPILTQTFIVKPYIQDAKPHSVNILWETNGGEESIVKWGLDENLENTITGVPYVSYGG